MSILNSFFFTFEFVGGETKCSHISFSSSLVEASSNVNFLCYLFGHVKFLKVAEFVAFVTDFTECWAVAFYTCMICPTFPAVT